MKLKYSRHTYSYLALRESVGWIGLLLPFVLMVGAFVLDGPHIRGSISHYYYSGVGDLFVGALCAIGLFMFFYAGHDKQDDWTGNVTGMFAILVAWFPTAESSPAGTIGKLHFVFAAALFLCLAYFSLFLFTKKGDKPTPRKLQRNWIYRICGGMLLLCLAAIAVYKWFIEKDGTGGWFTFAAETVGLVSFGVSWLTKGGLILPDKPAGNLTP